MKDLNRDEFPLLKHRHSTSLLLTSMLLGFALGFLVCHKLYSGIDKDKWEREVKQDYYYEEIEK